MCRPVQIFLQGCKPRTCLPFRYTARYNTPLFSASAELLLQPRHHIRAHGSCPQVLQAYAECFSFFEEFRTPQQRGGHFYAEQSAQSAIYMENETRIFPEAFFLPAPLHVHPADEDRELPQDECRMTAFLLIRNIAACFLREMHRLQWQRQYGISPKT